MTTIKHKDFKSHPMVRELFYIIEARGLSLDEVADSSGWSRSHLSLIKRGRRRTHAQMLQDVANSLGYKWVLVRIEP